MIELFGQQQIEIRTRILAKNISDEHRGDKTPGGGTYSTKKTKTIIRTHSNGRCTRA